MSEASLLVDIGNSRLKWCRLRDGVMGEVVGAAQEGFEPSALLDSWGTGEAPVGVWLSAVGNAAQTDRLVAALEAAWRVRPTRVRSTDAMPGIRNGYRQPGQLGVDRLLAALAAWHRVTGPVCVVDCGTATTLDFVAADGAHLGGFILPGLHMMRSALLDRTHIPRDAVVNETDAIPRDTPSAVAMAARHATAALIERFLDGPRSPFQGGPATLVIGGGDAVHIAGLLDRPAEPAGNLVLEGLAVLARQGDN